MGITSPAPSVPLRTGSQIEGFAVERVTPLPLLQAVACELWHRKSGARLLHLFTHDPENLLAISFRTPPPDDTGLPHILEHTVLCGSARFPVKDPFLEMLKTSLATFLNAMTYPDKTVYPCASMNRKDFFNLARVYCDAVFRPLLREDHFKQEGHHLDFAERGNTDSPLVVNGIVYNEMKGAYSDLDGIIDREQSRNLCPDNAYGRDSGGDPEAIPSLTYESFRQFHATYYHPSNARIFAYGDIPTAELAAFLNHECLAEFSSIPVDTSVPAQPRWTHPRHKTIPYPIGHHEDRSRKTAVVATFLTHDITDAIRSLSLEVLDYYLLGNAASPLRKALIDSKLGEELTPSGYADHQRDTFFTVGLKGTEERHTRTIADLIQTTCAAAIEKGLDRAKIDAAFHRLELHAREIGPMYPLQLMDRVYRSWLYDADPLHHLRIQEHLAELRRRYDTEEGFLERALAEAVIHNPHHTLLTFVPDPDYFTARENRFTARMAALKASMAPARLRQITEEADHLEKMQSAPNTPEALASLPRLRIDDVPREPRELDTAAIDVGGRPLLHTRLFANGMSYVQIAFDLRGISPDLIDALPLYAGILQKMGAGDEDYVSMAEREAACTGGVWASVRAEGKTHDPHDVQPFLIVGSKAINAKLPQMLQVLADRTLRCDFTDMGRLKDVVLQRRIHLRSDLVPSGTHYASLHAKRHLSRNSALTERFHGLSHVRYVDRVASEFDTQGPAIARKLDAIRAFIQARGRRMASFLGEDRELEITRRWFADLLAAAPPGIPSEEPSEFTPAFSIQEGVCVPTEVAFVAMAFPAVGASSPEAPVLALLGHQLGLDYLFQEVRIKGGAYGAHASFDRYTGAFTFGSYRDPHVRRTLDAYRRFPEYIAHQMDLSPGGIEQAIIGTLKTLDRPVRPSQACGVALGRYIAGETRETRRDFWARLLAVNRDDIRRVVADQMQPAFRHGTICVLAGREKLEAVNQDPSGPPLTLSDL